MKENTNFRKLAGHCMPTFGTQQLLSFLQGTLLLSILSFWSGLLSNNIWKYHTGHTVHYQLAYTLYNEEQCTFRRCPSASDGVTPHNYHVDQKAFCQGRQIKWPFWMYCGNKLLASLITLLLYSKGFKGYPELFSKHYTKPNRMYNSGWVSAEHNMC